MPNEGNYALGRFPNDAHLRPLHLLRAFSTDRAKVRINSGLSLKQTNGGIALTAQ